MVWEQENDIHTNQCLVLWCHKNFHICDSLISHSTFQLLRLQAYKAVLWNKTDANLRNITELIILAGLQLSLLPSVKIRTLKPHETKTSINLLRATQHGELSENLYPVKYLFLEAVFTMAHSCHPLYYGFTHCYITLVDNTATTNRMLREPYW